MTHGGTIETDVVVDPLSPSVLLVLSDTHGTDGHRLSDHLLSVARDADRVLHAGDFTTETVLDAFHDLPPRFDAVHGNADDPAVRDRLPAARTCEYGGVRIALTHYRDGGQTGLSLFGRERGADVVVSGHTHRPTVVDGRPTLINPGSHAQPRGNRAGYAVFEVTEAGISGELRDVDGATLERFAVDGA